MARYTIRDFTEVVGLGKDRDSVIRAGIVLKALCGIGLAREVGKRQGGNGRPAVVYEVDDPITIPLNLGRQVISQQAEPPQAPTQQVEPPQVPTQQVEAPQQAVAVAASNQSFYYDDDEED
jgi:hypothetical protein